MSKKIVITAGGTIEEIDPVRFISNYSSGKMGTALADAAYSQGDEVVLITTKEIEKPYKVVKVKSALDMKEAVEKEFDTSDCIIMAAAVADYRAKELSKQKIKKNNSCHSEDDNYSLPEESLCLELVKNPDILKELCQRRTGNKPMLVGFCAESENLEQNAIKKIQCKGCDYLIANDISRSDIGFSSNYNEVIIIDKHLNIKKLDKANKNIIAAKILEKIYE